MLFGKQKMSAESRRIEKLLKGREVMESLRGRVDPLVVDVLVRLAEDNQEINQRMYELAQLITTATETVTTCVMAITNMAGGDKNINELANKGS